MWPEDGWEGRPVRCRVGAGFYSKCHGKPWSGFEVCVCV